MDGVTVGSSQTCLTQFRVAKIFPISLRLLSFLSLWQDGLMPTTIMAYAIDTPVFQLGRANHSE